MELKNYSTYHLVKSEDLNHHGTLFAGRSAEWFVESGFIAAANLLDPKNVVCLKIHGMVFAKPVKLGKIVCYNSKIVHAGKSSLIAYIKVFLVTDTVELLLDGFATFIHVDENTNPKPHGVEIIPESDEDKELYQKALKLKNN